MAIGITAVYFLMNLIGQPSLKYGTPFPVVARLAFGVMGANIARFARHRRHRVVRRANLLRLQSRSGAGADILSGRGSVDAFAFHRPVVAGLGLLPLHVAVSTPDLSQRHGDHPQIHRFLRPGCLRRDVRAGDLGFDAERTVESFASTRPAGRGLGAWAYGERGHADRRLLCRAVAQFRRLLPICEKRAGDEARQLLRPSGQLHRLRDHHRDRDGGHREGV